MITFTSSYGLRTKVWGWGGEVKLANVKIRTCSLRDLTLEVYYKSGVKLEEKYSECLLLVLN